MKRITCLLCLLVPLAVGTAAPGRPDPPARISMHPIHGSAASAVFSDHSAASGTLPPAAIGRDAARDLRESGWPGPAPARESLVHADLLNGTRLAAITRPQWEADPQGHTRLNVGILSLRW